MNEQWIARIWDSIQTRTLKYSGHFAEQLFTRSQPERDDVRYIVCDDAPRIIEHYEARPHPLTGRGSCLILGIVNGRAAHVNCSYPPDPVVITTYWPDTEPDEWADGFSRRVAK